MAAYTEKVTENMIGDLPRVQTDDFTIVYRKIGQGPVIVLIHGFPESGSLWQNVANQLAANYTVIIPDLPGAGDSTFNGDNLSVDILADSIKTVLEKENVESAVIAGHSMGGYVALAFAENYPAELKGLSLVHSVANADSGEKVANRLKAIELLKKGGKESFVKQMIPALFSDAFKEENPAIVPLEVEKGLQLEVKSMIAFYNAMIQRPERFRILEEATIPVQFILGANDNIIPLEDALKQAKLPKNNMVSVYDNCGHMSMLEQPQKLVNDLNKFLKVCFV